MTKRAHRKKEPSVKETSRRDRGGGGKSQVKKAVFETTKKKEVGVSDLTLISKISNEAINVNRCVIVTEEHVIKIIGISEVKLFEVI